MPSFGLDQIEQSIPARFAQQVDLHAKRIAVVFEDERLSYEQLNRCANRVARAIEVRGQPVAILLDQGVWLIAAILGVLKSGNFYVALDPADRGATRAGLVDSGARLVLTDARNEATCSQPASAGCKVLRVDAEAIRPGSDGASQGEHARDDAPVNCEPVATCDAYPAISPDALAYIYYTSGSTGVAKGVFDNHRNVLHNVMRYTANLGITHEDGLTLVQAPGFSGAVSSMFCALLNGATLYPFDLRRNGIDALARTIASEPITIYHSVPTIFERLVATGLRFPRLRAIRLEGDRATQRHVALFQQRFEPPCQLVNGLGATEFGIACQKFIDARSPQRGAVVPVGRPTQDIEILILGENGASLADGEVGEIAVRSRYLACGYWRRPDLTRESFTDATNLPGVRVYQSRDLGRINEAGELEHLGRKDLRSKVDGVWIELEAIESVIAECERVSEVVVDTRLDASGRAWPVAYLKRARASVAWIDLVAEVRERLRAAALPRGSVPRSFIEIEHLPLDANGKVARRALPDPGAFEHEAGSARTIVPGRNSTELRVAEHFRLLLERQDVSVNEDFFELGGDSLAAVELAIRLERDFGVSWPIAGLGGAYSVESIAAYIDSDASIRCVVPLSAAGGARPVFLVHAHMGHVFKFDQLAARVDPAWSLHGVQARGWHGRGDWIVSVEELAARYLSEIVRIQPSGPYAIGGICFGSLVAVEIARQLRRSGADVDHLLLVGPEPVRDGATRRTVVDLARRLADLRALERDERAAFVAQRLLWRWQSARRAIDRLVWRVCAKSRLPLPRSLRPRHRMIEMMQRDYVPSAYDGSALVILCNDEASPDIVLDSLGGLVRGPMSVCRIPVARRDLLAESGIGYFAHALNQCLAQPDAAATPVVPVGKRIGSPDAILPSSPPGRRP